MTGAAIAAGPRRRRLHTGTIAIALAGLAGCGAPPVQGEPANEQSLRAIGDRNDAAAVKAAVEQRGRARAEADMLDADRREAARPPGGQE